MYFYLVAIFFFTWLGKPYFAVNAKPCLNSNYLTINYVEKQGGSGEKTKKTHGPI